MSSSPWNLGHTWTNIQCNQHCHNVDQVRKIIDHALVLATHTADHDPRGLLMQSALFERCENATAREAVSCKSCSPSNKMTRNNGISFKLFSWFGTACDDAAAQFFTDPHTHTHTQHDYACWCRKCTSSFTFFAVWSLDERCALECFAPFFLATGKKLHFSLHPFNTPHHPSYWSHDKQTRRFTVVAHLVVFAGYCYWSRQKTHKGMQTESIDSLHTTLHHY